MPTTRGSILISTANDIGEALVEKLGGVGYSPNEWKEKYNLCGIAPVDSAPALSVLADSAGTGDERGSILIATADAIGAILNKKYNVLRGFKPKEWASACRKMKALEEGSVASASIASFSDGADTVPLTSCVCSIDANLDGKTAVAYTHVRGGNFYNLANGRQLSLALPKGTTIYCKTESPSTYIKVYMRVKGASTSAVIFDIVASMGVRSYTLPDDIEYLSMTENNYNTLVNGGYKIMISLESDGDYTPYITPETKTADLGRAVYGGSADIIKGEGKDTCSLPTLLSSLTWNKTTIGGHDCFYANLPNGYIGIGSSYVNGACDSYAITFDGNMGTDKTIRFYYNESFNFSRVSIRDDQYASLTGAQFKETVSGNIVYELAESAQTDFTFEPVKIDSFDGVNNIWNDCGDTAVEYYQAPTPYARKTATGGIANFSDQRTDLPLTKAIANIAPSIAGKSAVNLYRAGRNLLLPYNEDSAEITVNGIKRSYSIDNQEFTFEGTNTKTDASWLIYSINASDFVLNGLKSGTTYIFSHNLTADMYAQFTYNKTGGGIGAMGYLRGNAGQNASVSFILPSDFGSLRQLQIGVSNTATYVNITAHFQVEVGSSSSAYVPYQDPTTYTAELGETVYGGSVDFVSGEVVNDCTKDSMSSSYLSGLSLETYIGYEAQTAYFNYHPSIWVRNWNYQTAAARTAGGIKCACDEFPASMNNTTIFASQYRIYFDVNGKNISSVQDFIDYVTNLEQNGKQLEITYELATPTESAIPGRVISPIEGVNNYWNDAGGDTEIQYFEDET